MLPEGLSEPAVAVEPSDSGMHVWVWFLLAKER